MGDGFVGDIAIDEVTLSTASCNTLPSSAKPGVSGKYLKIANHSISDILHSFHIKAQCISSKG